jgi:hypothetical protein
MKRHLLSGAIAAGIVAACSGRAAAQDASESARLQKLEQAVSQLQQENQQLKSQIGTGAAQAASPGAAPGQPNGKFDISSSVTSIRIFGDLGITYRVNEAVAAGRDANDTGQLDRLRYRLRLGTDVKVADGWTMGVVLETNANGRSTTVTLGGGGFNDGNFAKGNSSTTTVISSVTPANGTAVTAITSAGKAVTGTVVSSVASKTATVVSKVTYQDSLFVGQVFLKYQPFDWLTVEAGKFRPNLVTTRMVWDPELNGEGLAESFLWHFGGDKAAHGPAGPEGYDKDGKESKVVGSNPGISFDLFGNFAQYVYDDAGFENAFNSGNGTATSPLTQNSGNTSNWLLGFQVGGRVNFTPTSYFQIAPTYYCYTEGGSYSNTGFFNGDNALVVLNKNATSSLITFNQTSTNNLGIFDVPVEFGSKIGKVPFSIFGDFADNLFASERAANAGHPDKGNEGIAWQAGLSLGEIKHKGDWELRGWYQHSEQFALDPNLIDDQYFDGRLNMEGIYVSASYALAEALTVTAEFSNGHRIDPSLGTAGVGTLGTAAGFPLQSVNLFYLSFALKF